MADGVATFVVNLDGNLASGAATGSRSLEDLRAEVLESTGALRQMEAAMRSLKGGASTDVEAFKTLRAQITAQKAKIAGLNTEYVKLGGNFKKLDPPKPLDTVNIQQFGQTLNSLPGPLGSASQGVNDLSAVIGSGGLAGAAVIGVAALVALSVAVIAVTAKVAQFALTSADAARSQMLLWQAALKGKEGAEGIAGAVERVRKNVALSREALTGMATGLTKAGLRGAQLESALEAIGIAQAVGLDTGKLEAQIKATAKLGGSVEAVTKKIRDQYGGIAQKQMLGLGAQATKLKDDIAAIFGDVKIEGFLKGMKEVLDLFDGATSSGKAFKQLATSLLSPLFESMGKGSGGVKDFFRGMIIGALRAAIVILTLRNKLRDATKDVDFSKATKGLKLLGVSAGIAAVSLTVIAFAVGAIVVGLTIMTGMAVATGALIVGAFAAIVAGVAFVTIAIGKAVISGVSKLLSLGKSAMDAGAAFGQGLANGIKNGAGLVAAAAQALAASAVKAIKDKLLIASPSKVGAQLGGFYAEGVEGGIDDGARGVQGAADALVSIPTKSAMGDLGGDATQGAAGGGGSSSGNTYHVAIYGVDSAEQLTDPSMAAKMAATLERVLTIAGLNPEPA